MAHIFKYPKDNSKGIIVFTHKEWPWLLQNALSTLQDLKQMFYLGWNQGTYFGEIQMPNIVDFSFSSPSTLTYKDNGNTLYIPLCGRNFLTSDFKNLDIKEKNFDIISTSRAVKIKQLPPLLHSIKKLNNRGIYPKTLFIIPTAENETPEYADINIVKTFNELFTVEEKKHITMMRLSPELGFLGINQQTLNWFYNNSKILYIGSKSEGNCRVVHEALMGGCNIVYYKNHKGALVDYLDKTNSTSYDTHENIDIALEKALKSYTYSKIKTDSYEDILRERTSLKKLIPYFEKLYELNNSKFDGELINYDNLSNRFPAHYLDVPWNSKDPKVPTADIKTLDQLTIFINYINGNWN